MWSRNAVSDTGVTAPIWGFSSSPLVVDDVVIVAASGALIAYDLASGNPRWFHPGPVTGESYSSPQLFTIDICAPITMYVPPGVEVVITRFWARVGSNRADPTTNAMPRQTSIPRANRRFWSSFISAPVVITKLFVGIL